MSSDGMDCGKLRRMGSRTVKIGIDRSRFDGWCWNRTHTSFALSMMVREVRKKVHSMRMLVGLVMVIPVPYQWMVAGQRSCMPWSVR